MLYDLFEEIVKTILLGFLLVFLQYFVRVSWQRVGMRLLRLEKIVVLSAYCGIKIEIVLRE